MNDRARVNLLTRLRVDFSDLRLHKFDHRFNCDSPLCSCGQGSESTVHFFAALPVKYWSDGVLLDSVSEIIFSDVRVYPDQHESYSSSWERELQQCGKQNDFRVIY